MRKFSSRMAIGALIATIGLATAGCGQVRMLKAKMAFKDANQLYQQQDYKAASAKYEEAIAADPSLTYSYFFLANSYDNQFRPARRGEAANDAMLTKAIENYKKSTQVEQDPKIKKLAMEYLVAAYGSRKEFDLIVRLHYPGMAFDTAARAVELFGERVLPALKGE